MNCTNDTLYVVSVISNPIRFKKRYELFNDFCERMKKEKGIKLITLELQQNNRDFITDAEIKLKTNCEIWEKENLINIAARYLPHDWKYLAWIDADIEFQNKNWVKETLDELQIYSVLQLFQHAIDLGPNCETMNVHTSFMSLYVNNEKMNNYTKWKNYKNGHTGYAWAITRKAFDDMGGLLDFCILGSGDAHMALSFIGEVEKSLHSKLNNNYKLLCKIFQERCEKYIQRNVGYVKGTILHHWHGSKSSRQYSSRWQILIENDFDPLKDIKRAFNGTWQLDITANCAQHNKIKLRDSIRKYFKQRNEDENTLKDNTQFVKIDWI